jgi:hypothetical protein
MTLETNTIKEIAPGVYWVLLWCPESTILGELLDPQTPYVLCWSHEVGNYTWQEFRLPLVEPTEIIGLVSRMANFDFIVPTGRFLEILPKMRPAIRAVQLGKMPPDYLDMRTIKGKQLYRILGECDWHVLIDTPANDYGQVMSPKRNVLEKAVETMERVQD